MSPKPGNEAIGAQAEVLAYRGGLLAVAAVPGAGKTHVLTELLAVLAGAPDAPVRPHRSLVLTYMRSAAAEFRHRAHEALSRQGHSAHGLSVSTLHGFAAKILFEADGGMDESGGRAAHVWNEGEQRQHLLAALSLVMEQQQAKLEDFEAAFGPWEGEANSRRKAGKEVAFEVANKVLAQLRHLRQGPEAHWSQLEALAPGLGAWIQAYETERRRWRALDYDGLVAAATDRLENDAILRGRLQHKHRLVIEDEAQDATPLQMALVARLVDPQWGGSGHWVRVGDPNQAIMAFAGSDASGFRAWVQQREMEGRRVSMNQAGRCAQPILAVANAFVRACRSHPDPRIAGALDGHAFIHPVLEGPRANPQEWASPRFTIHSEVEAERMAVVAEVGAFLQAHPQATAAILVRTNLDAEAYRLAAQNAQLPFAESMPSAPRFKALLLAVAAALRCLALPTAPALSKAIQELHGALAQLDGRPQGLPLESVDVALLAQRAPYPYRAAGLAPESYDASLAVAELLYPWWGARHLPPDELAMALAYDLSQDQEAAWWMGQALAQARLSMRHAIDPPQDPRLALALALAQQATQSKNKEPASLELPQRKSGLIVRTMHRAKGAEYDGVWLAGLMDTKDELWPWDAKKLWATRPVLLKLLCLMNERPYHPDEEADASRAQASAENLRLLYVGLTRAKRVLRLSGHHPASVPPLGPHREALAKACGGLA